MNEYQIGKEMNKLLEEIVTLLNGSIPKEQGFAFSSFITRSYDGKIKLGYSLAGQWNQDRVEGTELAATIGEYKRRQGYDEVNRPKEMVYLPTSTKETVEEDTIPF